MLHLHDLESEDNICFGVAEPGQPVRSNGAKLLTQTCFDPRMMLALYKSSADLDFRLHVWLINFEHTAHMQ